MRYGPITENPGEEIIIGQPDAPRAILDTFLPLLQGRAIMAGVSLGVFEGLRAALHFGAHHHCSGHFPTEA